MGLPSFAERKSPEAMATRTQDAMHRDDTKPRAEAQGVLSLPGDRGGQLLLPLDHAPAVMRDHGYAAAHSYPRVSDGERAGGEWRTWRIDPPRAWPMPYIELDAAKFYSVLDLDCDNPAARIAGEDAGRVPVPSVRTINPANGHQHLLYVLESPVARYPETHPKPLRLLSRISEFYTEAVAADTAFNATITPNPTALPPGRIAEWCRRSPFSLGELADWIPSGWRLPVRPRSAVARGRRLFMQTCRWAGSPRNRYVSAEALEAFVRATAACREGRPPLPESGLRGIVRAVLKYRAGWEAAGWHKPAWIERQRRRGKRGGKVSGRVRAATAARRRERALQMRSEGLTYRAIGEALGCSVGAAHRYVRGVFNEANTDDTAAGASFPQSSLL